MKGLFVWVSVITGILPGMAVILNGFGTPEDLRMPFGIIAAASGFLAFGVVALIRETIARRNRKLLAGLIIVFSLVGLVSLCAYWMVLDQCVFQSPQRSSVFFPLWLESRAKEVVDSAGGRKAYYEKYGAGAVATLLQGQTDEVNRTEWLLLLLIATASVALPVASGIMSAFPDRQSVTGPLSKKTTRTRAKARSKGASRGGNSTPT